MIKFTDVLKANVRYFYVLIICMLLFFAIVFGIKYDTNDYEAINNTYYITSGSQAATQAQTEEFYTDMSVIINNSYFYKDVVTRAKIEYPKILDDVTAAEIKNGLSFTYDKKANRITASFVGKDEDRVFKLLNLCLNEATEKYVDKPGAVYELTQWYPITVRTYETKNAMFALIGLLVGLVVGEIVITCIVAFSPYVQDKEMLERIIGINILTSLKKEGKGNENK